jgi:hypothetical protein
MIIACATENYDSMSHVLIFVGIVQQQAQLATLSGCQAVEAK